MIMSLYSCEKKKDESPPQLLVTSPAAMESFLVGDSIHVKAEISHTSSITYIKIALVNDDGIPMLVPKYIHPAGTSYSLDYKYFINKNLESGTYSLLVSVGDGTNTAKKYTPVEITGIGRFFQKLLAVCRPSSLKTIIYAIDADGNYANVMNLDHPYTDSDISSDQRQLYLLKPSPDILYGYDLDSLSEDFSVMASPPYPQYNSVSYFKYPSLAYTPNANGEIRGFDNLGSSLYITPTNPDTIPMQCWHHDNMILAYCERRGGPQRFIRQYYKGTGVFRADLKINFSILEIFSQTPDQAVIFGNNDSTGKAYIYDVTGNALYIDLPVPQGLISHVVQISEEIYLVAHENGIYKYDHDGYSWSLWLDDVEADVLTYDDLRQFVYIANGEKVMVYNYNNFAQIQEISLPYEVLNLHVQYNK